MGVGMLILVDPDDITGGSLTGLTLEEVALFESALIAASPENLQSRLNFLRQNFSRLKIYVDVRSLRSWNDVVEVLNNGASKVFVTFEQLKVLSQENTILPERLVLTISPVNPKTDIEKLKAFLEANNQWKSTEWAVDGDRGGEYVDAVLHALDDFPPNPDQTIYVTTSSEATSAELLAKYPGNTLIVSSRWLTLDSTKEGHKDLIPAVDLFLAGTTPDRKTGLYTTTVVDERGVSLGLVYSNLESITKALQTRSGVYWSRKRGLWPKGASSGDTQELISLSFDCDKDCLQFRLQRTLQDRKKDAPEGSYTARLFSDPKLVNAKIKEEADELCEATTKEDIASEAADLLYFALARCVAADVSLEDIEKNLDLKSLKVKRRKGDAKPQYVDEKPVTSKDGKSHSQIQGEQLQEASSVSSASKDLIDLAGKNEQSRIQLTRYSTTQAFSDDAIKTALQRPAQRSNEKVMNLVAPIISDVRENGDRAVLKYTHRFERATSLKSPILKSPFPKSLMQLPDATRNAINVSYDNILKFHLAQKESAPLIVTTMPGVTCSRFSRPIEKVGLYVPGGTAVLPSTAMMLGVPAMAAGCKSIVLASPPRSDGTISPEIVYIADKIGAESIVLAGGAQAIAAMAYGTESVTKVDKILGPGNQFVTAAKMIVSNDTTASVSIDMPAGPSEVLVIADRSADPAFVASDLLSQAEHGPDSQVVLITVDLDEKEVLAIEDEVHRQANALPRVDIVRGALEHSATILVPTISEALKWSNYYAPEHLILQVEDPKAVLPHVQNAGSVFLGKWTPESVGDYSAGVNHSLPTYGYARQYSGVNLASFMKHITSSEVNEEGVGHVGPAVVEMARCEGLDAHQRAMEMRMEHLGMIPRQHLPKPKEAQEIWSQEKKQGKDVEESPKEASSEETGKVSSCLQDDGVTNQSRSRRKSVSYTNAYSYALRVAYLSYLLQPRSKRKLTIPANSAAKRSDSSTSINDLVNDFRLVSNHKSAKLPHDFIKELVKRVKGVLVGTEKSPEYHENPVKRTFGVFFNQLSDPSFRKRMEESRRAEELVLIFFSNATKELQQGKPPGDDTVKRLVDRHLALFVRLLSSIMRDKQWAGDRPELASRLVTLEKKLLRHDEDLANPTTVTGALVEEVVPLSYEVSDMPLVQVVGRIFGLNIATMQSDIEKHKDTWTELAALQDLKTYQTDLNTGTRRTLNVDDFDTHEAYQSWKKSEDPELSQSIATILHINPDLAKVSAPTPITKSAAPTLQPSTDASYHDPGREDASPSGFASPAFDTPDLNSLLLADSPEPCQDEADYPYTFLPPDPRSMFRFIMITALTYDLNHQVLPSDNGSSDSTCLLSNQSIELLNEIAFRWRIPKFSRMVLFLDVVKEKYVEKGLSLDALDAAFNYVKFSPESEHKSKRASLIAGASYLQRDAWTIADFVLIRKLINELFQSLLRDLYEVMMTAYEEKTHLSRLGSIMTIIDEQIRNDPGFNQSTDHFVNFRNLTIDGLESKAQDAYGEALAKQLPLEPENWEFWHVQQLAKNVLKLAEKIQKRFKKTPEILGINPLLIFLNIALPAFAEDSKAMVQQIINQAKSNDAEVPIQDGFDLYKDLSEFRRVYADALPHIEFPYKLEDLLADFVWRWIKITEEQVIGWVANAVGQDDFSVRTKEAGQVPTEDQRHSVSVIDIFKSFNQIVEQVAQLNWDDDLTYAKFMTAVAKAVGNGVTKYCDLVDQMFSKEMDRLTPEQEAAATMSRQEKWMQLAKDAWNNTQRVEPFQFYPQSFVKLNNIAFAIQHWDKLEQEINVDGCADVLKSHNPPSANTPRRTTNYVFTIKIVEAEDLKACDVNGFSDPYLVLTDEYQKRLFKSRTIYRTLTPRWDESIDIATQGPLNLIATIWDWDVVGDHDYVGRTSLKLDPSHFGDFLPREYWLDLDTQGRLLVRVSMEGERDDIQFYFGKAFRTLQRTQRDMTRKITDKLSAYINHCLSRRALKALLNRGISMSSVSSYFNRQSRNITPTPSLPSDAEILNALKPLFTYFDDNFAIMNQTLTPDAMIAVMTRLWKEVLVTIESLLVPPLSDKPSSQKPLTQHELDIVFKWLQSLFEFFHAVDEETGQANGVPIHVLKNPKYHEIQTLNFFYFESTENLIRTSERMASANAASHLAQRTRLSAPPSLQQSMGGGLLVAGSIPSTRRAKSILLSRNLGTMKKAKEEKWKQAQAEPSDDMILRILRMRSEAVGYLRDRSRQKERLAAAAAAELIVKQSLLQGGGRMTGPSVMRR
ncbi:hypothetical protein DV738_g3841, partial [Chaetothyriales sp. CBS 135597]